MGAVKGAQIYHRGTEGAERAKAVTKLLKTIHRKENEMGMQEKPGSKRGSGFQFCLFAKA
jgi:hypothetical protein